MAATPTLSKSKSKTVAVVVPIYKEGLTGEEEISFRHIEHYLAAYDKYIAAPEGLPVERTGYEVKRFKSEFFHSTTTYSALLLSREFYETFAQYEYILIHQTDALVLSDALEDWCSRDLDYVGAPWFKGEGVDFVDEPAVGNGGFSLRRVDSFLRVVSSPGFEHELDRYRDAITAARPWLLQLTDLPRKALRRVRLALNRGRSIFNEDRDYTEFDPGERLNEDCFWSFRAVRYDPGFKVASVAEGLKFSWEMSPRHCFELNERRLPFGCHAWNKYDREFWEPYLLPAADTK